MGIGGGINLWVFWFYNSSSITADSARALLSIAASDSLAPSMSSELDLALLFGS